MSRHIDADKLSEVLERNFGHTGGASALKQLIDEQPTADVVEVVRCKKCKHFKQSRKSENEGSQIGLCWELGTTVTKDNFCSYGERKEHE